LLGGRRRLLREEFRSGRLEQASSKAAVLSDLCDRLKYDSDAATEVHKGIYTERIESFLEKKTISGALLRSATLQRGMLAMHLVLHRAEYLNTCIFTLEMERLRSLVGPCFMLVLFWRQLARARRVPKCSYLWRLTPQTCANCADEEAEELTKLRKLLCLSSEAVADIDRATKGRIFRSAVNDALGAGIDGFTQVRAVCFSGLEPSM